MTITLLLWLLLAVVVGYMGRHRAAGFFGTFIAAVLFSPLIVVIVLLLSQPARPSRASRTLRQDRLDRLDRLD
jgi:hypothetical protein